MSTQIPQDILDKMASMVEMMQEFIEKSKNNMSAYDIKLQRKTIVSCKSLSREISKLAGSYGYSDIKELPSNAMDIDACSLAVDDLETRFEILKYINNLSSGSSSS